MNKPIRREFMWKLIKDGERTTKKYRYKRIYICNIGDKSIYQIYRTNTNNKLPFMNSYREWKYLGQYEY